MAALFLGSGRSSIEQHSRVDFDYFYDLFLWLNELSLNSGLSLTVDNPAKIRPLFTYAASSVGEWKAKHLFSKNKFGEVEGRTRVFASRFLLLRLLGHSSWLIHRCRNGLDRRASSTGSFQPQFKVLESIQVTSKRLKISTKYHSMD